MERSAEGRLAFIDGLRAVAVLAVVASHSAYALRFGEHGVDLFFVISGYCLSYPTLKKFYIHGHAIFDVALFAAHRIARIVPPYWCAIALIFLLIPGSHVPLPDLAKQALFLDRNTVWINQSFWTLAVELRWYIVFPGLLWIWISSPRAFGVCGVACLVAATMTRASSLDIQVLPAFMLGIVAADLGVRGVRCPFWLVVVGIAMTALAVVLTWYDNVNGRSAAWQIAVFILVFCVGSFAPLTRALSIRPLVWIGVASYSIYLVHYPVLALLYTHGINIALAAFAAIVGGFAFWAVCERPFQSISGRAFLLKHLRVLPEVLTALGCPLKFEMHAKCSRAETQTEVRLSA